MGDAEGEGFECEGVVVVEEGVWGWACDGESQGGREVEDGVIEPGFFEGVDVDFGVWESGSGFEEACDVVCVGVGEDYFFDSEFLVFYGIEEGFRLVATIDDPAGFVGGGGVGGAIGEDEAVCLKAT